MKAKFFLITLVLMQPYAIRAAESRETIPTDSVCIEKKRNIINKIIDYFAEANKVHRSKNIDFSIIGGPHYSSDTKFGIGLVAAGLYYNNINDTVLPPSNMSVYFDATTSLFFKLGVRGTHIFKNDSRRFNYDVSFSSVKTKFWGIGYDNNVCDDNESKYKYLNSQVRIDFSWRLCDGLYLGPLASFDYINGRDFKKPWLWEDQNNRTFNIGAGLTFQYDTRDNMTAPAKGVYIRFDQRFNPRFLANKYAFSLTEFKISGYKGLWRGSVLAAMFHTRMTYGNTPWGLMSTLGGSDNMRGYFEGRYRDKCAFDCCVEVRQHIWRRNGLVAWGGMGMVFPKISQMRSHMLLPNYGIGYRWEFKKRVNVRLDLGFGRHQTGFIFSINEAF